MLWVLANFKTYENQTFVFCIGAADGFGGVL